MQNWQALELTTFDLLELVSAQNAGVGWLAEVRCSRHLPGAGAGAARPVGWQGSHRAPVRRAAGETRIPCLRTRRAHRIV